MGDAGIRAHSSIGIILESGLFDGARLEEGIEFVVSVPPDGWNIPGELSQEGVLAAMLREMSGCSCSAVDASVILALWDVMTVSTACKALRGCSSVSWHVSHGVGLVSGRKISMRTMTSISIRNLAQLSQLWKLSISSSGLIWSGGSSVVPIPIVSWSRYNAENLKSVSAMSLHMTVNLGKPSGKCCSHLSRLNSVIESLQGEP